MNRSDVRGRWPAVHPARWAVALAAAALVGASGTAQAMPMTFAQYIQQDSGTSNDVQWTVQSVGGGANQGTLSTIAPRAVDFKFLASVPGLSAELYDGVPATLEISLVTATAPPNNAGSLAGTLIQPMDLSPTGTIKLTRVSDGSNLLTVVVGGGSITGQAGGGGGSYSVSSNGGNTVTFTSDYVNFADPADLRTAALALSSLISPPGAGTNQGLTLDATTNLLQAFTATSAGTFSGVAVAVPEPSTLALVGLGLVAAPLALRRRRARVAPTAG